VHEPEPPPRATSSPAARRSAQPATTQTGDAAAPHALAVPGVELDRLSREIEARQARLDSINRQTVKPRTFEKTP
ncbi:MAG TPA: hypothetical protein VJ596_06790, partial [Gemmatimonadaceae bacterium]|nr:hypothetical protein [Gemmatimonadaceae bacterium]